MTAQLGWYNDQPDNSFFPPEETQDPANYDPNGAGTASPDDGAALAIWAGITGVDFETDAIVWSTVWVPIVDDGPPSTTQQPSDGLGPLMILGGGGPSSNYHNGTLTITATLNGVPVPGSLVAVFAHDGGTYGTVGWQVIEPPVEPNVVDFVGSPRTGLAPLLVDFTDLSSGPDAPPNGHSWQFGDGGTSSEANPSHEYVAAGTYDVALTASFGGGGPAPEIVFQTSFEGTVGPPPNTFACAIGSVDPDNDNYQPLQNDYVHSGATGLKWAGNNQCVVVLAAPLAVRFDVVVFLKIPQLENWLSNGCLFRADNLNPGIMLQVNNAGTFYTFQSNQGGDDITPPIACDGLPHKYRFYCTGTKWKIYIDDVLVGTFTMPVPNAGGQTKMGLSHPGSDYYAPNYWYGDDLTITNNPNDSEIITETKVGYIVVTEPTPPPTPEEPDMNAPVLPISRLINVAVNLSPKAAAAQSLSTMLLLGSSPVIDPVERYRVYSDISAVASDFGTTAPEYLAAVLWFEQVPQPSNLYIGRWIKTASQGQLIGAPLPAASQLMTFWNPITNGRFTYTKDAGSAVTTGDINFAGAVNMPAVAALISAQTSGIVFTWDPTFQRFVATSATTGATSAVSFLSTPGSGTDISGLLAMRADSSGAYVSGGSAPETAIACVQNFDLNYGMLWYGCMIIGATDGDHLTVAPFLNATTNKHVYFVSTQEAGVLVDAVTNDIASMLKAAGYRRAWVQFSSSNPYAAMSAAARIMTTDYNGNNTVITLMYKQEPGIVPENMNTTQANTVDSKNANVFAAYNNDTAIIQRGTCADGTFLDELIGTDWLATTIQTALYNLLYLTSTKIPQTDAGSQLMVTTIEKVCDQGVQNGLLAPGQWTTTGFGLLGLNDYLQKGYYVYAPRVATQNVSDRAARKAVSMQVAAKLAGAVHTIQMQINVNR